MMKKKMFAILLSLTMLTNFSTTAFASNQTSVSTGTYTSDVTGSYLAGGTGSAIYSVDITWEGLSFTYEASGKQWNPTTHSYEEKDKAGWADNTGKITITNHSNAEIKVTPTYTPVTAYGETNMLFSTTDEVSTINGGSITIGSADNGTDGSTGSAVTETITVTPDGTLPEGTKDAKIGSITIQISGSAISSGDGTESESTNTTP